MGARIVLSLVVTLLAAVAGCGGTAANDSGDSGSGPDNPPFTARVEITKEGYRPVHTRILVGGRITFVNVDKTGLHTAETEDIPDGASDNNEFDTHTLTWEEPYTVTFHKPETVTFHNSLDPEMQGTVEAVPKQ